MNDLTTTKNGALAAANALKGKLAKTRGDVGDTGGGNQFLRFLTDGNWVFGQENNEVMPDDEVAANPLSIKTGWVCWTDRAGKKATNEVLGEMMVPLGGEPIAEHELPERRDSENDDTVCKWKKQSSVELRFLTGPYADKQVLYKTSSVGGLNAFGGLIDQIMLQLDEDPEHIVPVLSLDADHYPHKVHGRTYVPVLKVIDFISMDGAAPVEEEPEAEPEEEPEEKPARRSRAKKEEPEEKPARRSRAKKEEPEEEPDEQEEEAPRRRRRR